MPGIKLALTLAVAAYAIGKYFFGGKDEDPPPPDPYYSSSSYNSGTTRTQTRQPSKPPPSSPSYTYRPSATNAYSQTTARTPAPPDYGRAVHHPSVASPYTRTPQPPSSAHSQTTARTSASPDYGRGIYRSSVASPYTRTPSQTQPSSARTQASRQSYSSLFDAHEPPEYEYFQNYSHVPSRVHTESEPRLSTVIQVVSSDPRSDEPASVEDLDFAKKLREQARRRGRDMSEVRSRAKNARKKGYLGAAHAHRQEAIVYESAMKNLDKRAAEIIFRENNKNRKEGGKIDLHGLHVAEAVQFAKDHVQTARSRGDEVVRFIVGKGLHSDDGEAKIRPALEAHFTKRGLVHSLDPKNAGVLIVRLD